MADGILWNLAAQAGQNAFANGPDAYMQGRDWREQQDLKSNRKTILQQIATDPNGASNPNGAISSLIKSGDLAGATALAQASKMLQPETTDEIREYHLDQQQRAASGQPPVGFTEWKTAIKTASAPKINNVVNTGDNQYAKSIAEMDVKDLTDKNKLGTSATNRLNTLNVMDNLAKDPNFYSGWSAPTALKTKQALVSLGVANPNVTSATEAFDALSKKLVLDITGGSLGTGFSNADRDFVVSQVASLQNTPEGIKQLIDIQRKLATRDQQISQMARDYARKNGGRYSSMGFNDQAQKYSNENPLFPTQQPVAPPQAAPQQGAPQGAVPPPQQRQIGQTYPTPRGPARWMGNGWQLVQ